MNSTYCVISYNVILHISIRIGSVNFIRGKRYAGRTFPARISVIHTICFKVSMSVSVTAADLVSVPVWVKVL